MGNALEITELDWDSEQLGIQCASLDLLHHQTDVDECSLIKNITALLNDRCNLTFLTIKLPEHLLNTKTEVIKMGGMLVDTELTFVATKNNTQQLNEVKTRSSETLNSKYSSEFCKQTKATPFIELANEMKLSRFFNDENIGLAAATKLWQCSIKNHCQGFADELLVAYYEQMPAGLITMRISEDNSIYLHIVGVLKKFQAKGIGKNMLADIINRYGEHYSIYVETQSVNINAQKLYKGAGFSLDNKKYILHYWGK